MRRFFSEKVRKHVEYFGLFWVFSAFLEVRRRNKYCLRERGKFSFLYVDICFDVTKCKFIGKNSSFEMLVVFSSIFVTDTKITFVYNFVAPYRSRFYRLHERFHFIVELSLGRSFWTLIKFLMIETRNGRGEPFLFRFFALRWNFFRCKFYIWAGLWPRAAWSGACGVGLVACGNVGAVFGGSWVCSPGQGILGGLWCFCAMAPYGRGVIFYFSGIFC